MQHANSMNMLYPDLASQSTASSPQSQLLSLDSTSQASQSARETHALTPPSSIDSSQEHLVGDEEPRSRQGSVEWGPLGRKRTADGQIKEGDVTNLSTPRHARNLSTLSQTSTGSVSELSQSLKTRLTYAMVKVRNGWQNNSLDQVESLASQSPRTVTSALDSRDPVSLLSPRKVLALSSREDSGLSNSSTGSIMSSLTSNDSTTLAVQPGGLAPPADIVPNSRRRPTPNGHLQIHTMGPPKSTPSSSSRPQTQRTPSQNARMEADAVETLLFMSASPNTSGSHPSTFSPVSQTCSAHASPVRSQFSPRQRATKRYEDRAILLDRLLNGLDDDQREELDRAVQIMQQHQAAKTAA